MLKFGDSSSNQSDLLVHNNNLIMREMYMIQRCYLILPVYDVFLYNTKAHTLLIKSDEISVNDDDDDDDDDGRSTEKWQERQ